MKKIVFISILLFGLGLRGYPCITPAAPANTTNPKNLSICEGMSTKLSAKGMGTLGWYSAATGGTYLGNDTNFTTPELSKTTTFYLQDSTCGASASRTAITVIVNIHAKADFTVNDVCAERDSAIFINQSQNAETYVWKFGDGQSSNKFSPKHFYDLSKGIICFPNVTLVVVKSNGCSDSISKPINLNANPISKFTFTSNQTEVNFEAAQPNNTFYKWRFGNFDSSLITNPVYTFSKSGSYTVCLKVINAAKCFSETCKEVLITAGISPTARPNSLKIFPNPNSGNFIIEQTETKEILSIEIINQMGQVVHKTELNDYLNPMNLNLANGVYLIRVTNGENSLNQRMLVSK